MIPPITKCISAGFRNEQAAQLPSCHNQHIFYEKNVRKGCFLLFFKNMFKMNKNNV